MKHKIVLLVLAFCFSASLVFAQMDPAIDDATMSRLRLANLVFGSTATDMYVDGQIALLGSSERELSSVPVGWIPGFLYLEPGTHTAAIVPTGKSLDEAMVALEVTLEPGRRYSILVLGQREDATFTPLLIDETAALANARTSPEQDIMLLVNNLAGTSTLDFLEDGVGPSGVPYGGVVAAPIKAGHVDQLVVTINGDSILEDNPGNFDELPVVDFIHSYNGQFPGAIGATSEVYDSYFSSDLSALELLKQISDFDVVGDGQKTSFDTFLSAVEAAGLGDVLTTGTHFIFAPIDTAFEAMPAGQLEALMADPEALAEFLRHHIVEGYYPPGSLSGAAFSITDITLTTMQGADLVLGGGGVINGVNTPTVATLMATNGTRIAAITKVLLPPSP